MKKFIVNQNYVEELVHLCGHEVITGHILKDACTLNLDMEGIKKDIQTAVSEAKQFENPNALTINLINTE